MFSVFLGDGLIFDRSADFVNSLPEGCWVLGDSAFTVRPGRVERRRKKNELLPDDPARAAFILNLEKFGSKTRISSEWGVKDIKRSWLVLFCRLPSDDDDFRVMVWEIVIRLHNSRQRMMRVGQMCSVWIVDKECLESGEN